MILEERRKRLQLIERRRRALADRLETVFRDIFDPFCPKRPEMMDIVHQVAEKRGFKAADLLIRRRHKPLVNARHEALWRCRDETGLSYPEIAKFWNLDPSTVQHACQRHQERTKVLTGTS